MRRSPHQAKNQSGQDPLNFPIKLNNRLASLRRSVENAGDAKPTDGAYLVFNELSQELEQHLGKLENYGFRFKENQSNFNKRWKKTNLKIT